MHFSLDIFLFGERLNSGPQGWYEIGKAKPLYLIFSMEEKNLLILNKIRTKMLMPNLF